MLAGTLWRAAPLVGSFVLVAVLATSACAGSPDPPVAPSAARTSAPTAPDQPEPTILEEPAPATAQAVCEEIYLGRGSAPLAESGDIDDEMALFETWHAGLLQDAIAQLGSAPALASLMASMDEMRSLSVRAAIIYAEHPMFSEELSLIQERQSALAVEVVPVAVEAGAPACADLVVLP